MITNKKTVTTFGTNPPERFTVQICSKDGRLVNEYLLLRRKDEVITLAEAESKAMANIGENNGNQLVLVVSSVSNGNLKQVHRDIPSSSQEKL